MKPLKDALIDLLSSYDFVMITSDCTDTTATESTYLSDGEEGTTETYMFANEETGELIGLEVFIPEEGEENEKD